MINPKKGLPSFTILSLIIFLSTRGSVNFDGNSDLDLKGHKIKNLGHPVAEGDACNLRYVTKEFGATKRGPKGDQGDVGKMGPAGRQGVKGGIRVILVLKVQRAKKVRKGIRETQVE